MWMAWGPELTFFYNDTYAADTLATKHPWALGRRADEVWAEIWEDIGPRIEQVISTGTATWDEGLLLFLERSGYREETYHTFSYSPLRDEDGPGGDAVRRHRGDRAGDRRAAPGDAARAGRRRRRGDTERDLFAAVDGSLATNRFDLPFAFAYTIGDDGRPAAPSAGAPGWADAALLASAPAVVELAGRTGMPAGAGRTRRARRWCWS